MGLADSLTGNIEKAYIEIVDMRQADTELEASVKENQNRFGGAAFKKAFGNDIFNNVIDSAFKAAAQNGLNLNNLKDTTTVKTFTVQFNPSALSINAVGGEMVRKTNLTSRQDKKEGSADIEYEPMTKEITMSVDLIFDSEESVQTEVEGFIAALRSPYTRHIFFTWGKLTYAGILNNVSSVYTMFNINGHPIRAIVKLKLILSDEEIDTGAGSLGMWEKRFNEAFSTSRSLAGVSQKVESIFNFNL